MQWAVYILSAAIGAVVGVIYSFQEYNGKSSDEIRKSPRYKNLGIVLGAGLVGAAVDWRSLATLTGQNANVSRFSVVIWYDLAVITTVVLFLAVGIVAVSLEARHRNRRVARRARLPPIVAIGLFVGQGYAAYVKRVAKIDSEIEGVGGQDTTLVVTRLIRLARAAEQGFNTTRSDRKVWVQHVLGLAIDAVVAQMPEARFQIRFASCMRAIPLGSVSSEQLSMIPFDALSMTGCTEVLVPGWQINGAPESAALPVCENASQCIPGPPRAFRDNAVQAIVTNRVKPSTSVPKGLHSDIRDYFRRARYRSLLSVPIEGPTGVVGVLNVEADSEMFDPDNPRVFEIGESLYPLGRSLASLLIEDQS